MQLNTAAHSVSRFKINKGRSQEAQPHIQELGSETDSFRQSSVVQSSPRVGNAISGAVQMENLHLLNTIARKQKQNTPSRQQGQGYGQKNPNSHSWSWVKTARSHYQQQNMGNVRNDLSQSNLNSVALNRSEVNALLRMG